MPTFKEIQDSVGNSDFKVECVQREMIVFYDKDNRCNVATLFDDYAKELSKSQYELIYIQPALVAIERRIEKLKRFEDEKDKCAKV